MHIIAARNDRQHTFGVIKRKFTCAGMHGTMRRHIRQLPMNIYPRPIVHRRKTMGNYVGILSSND